MVNKIFKVVTYNEYETNGEKRVKKSECGIAKMTEKGNYMIYLNTLPTNGKLVLMLVEQDNYNQQKQQDNYNQQKQQDNYNTGGSNVPF